MAGPAQAAQHNGTVHPTVAGGISTVAGGVGGPGRATNVSLDHISNSEIDVGVPPCGVTFSHALYIAQGYALRKVNPATDALTTPAGTFEYGPAGSGGPATGASLDSCSVAVDHHGNLIIADRDNSGIRVVAAKTGTFYGQAMTAGDIYDVAGVGNVGPLTVDRNGNIVVASQYPSAAQGAVLMVVAAKTGYFYATHMTAGDVYRIAGVEAESGTVYSGNGGPIGKSTLGNELADIRTDAAGNIVMAGTTASRVLVIANQTGTFYGQAMTKWHIYSVAGTGSQGFTGTAAPPPRRR
ncbi:MAG TPA: hypothetical protein VGH27_23375 [Streptosporangiaceae bacterium]|jgi:hypothetical protein